MKVGNIVTWPWFLGTGWESTQMQGLIVETRIVKTDYEKVRIFNVFLTDGSLCDVREDEDGLELVV